MGESPEIEYDVVIDDRKILARASYAPGSTRGSRRCSAYAGGHASSGSSQMGGCGALIASTSSTKECAVQMETISSSGFDL